MKKLVFKSLNKLFFLLAFFPVFVWADDITIELTPTNSPIPAQIEKVNCIVIDPGNGGKDLGSKGYDNNFLEKDVNLKIAKKIVDLLRREPGLEVFLTRNGDDDISDKERIDFANSHKADIFVSIHCNQSESDKENGTILYRYASKTSDKPPEIVSKKINEDRSETIMIKLNLTLIESRSRSLGEMIAEQIINRLKQKFRNIRRASFYVLAHSKMPSIWIGMAYITNKDEVAKLGDSHWQDQMSEAIENGILAYRKIITEGPFGVSGPETDLSPGNKEINGSQIVRNGDSSRTPK